MIVVAMAMKFWRFHFNHFTNIKLKFYKYKTFEQGVLGNYTIRDFEGDAEVNFNHVLYLFYHLIQEVQNY